MQNILKLATQYGTIDNLYRGPEDYILFAEGSEMYGCVQSHNHSLAESHNVPMDIKKNIDYNVDLGFVNAININCSIFFLLSKKKM
jgi:hypothetical protein